MSLIPPAGWPELATTDDIALVRRDVDQLRHELVSLDHRMDSFEHRMDARFAAQEKRFDAKLDAALGSLRADLLRTFGTWLFASQAAVIAVVGILVSLR